MNNTNIKGRFPILQARLLIPIVFVLFLGVFIASNLIKYQKLGVTMENSIEAQYVSNQNNLSQLILKVKESLGVAKLNNAEFERIIQSSLEGRYGDEGASQVMLWVKENYPGSYNHSLMANVQQTILAGRTDFEAKQNILIDKVRVYKNQTEIFWPSMWLGLVGYPRDTFDWKRYDPVLAEGTSEIFESKIDKGLDIN